jgi:arsenate reductase
VLATRFAKERLAALAKVSRAINSNVCEVLFVCVHNAGRSQMAAGLLAQHGGASVHVRSAGSQPTATIDNAVVEAIAEVGVDITAEFPKPLTDDVVQAADVVVTMGCGDACPVYPGKRYLDWQVRDPAGLPLDAVRAIRTDIDNRVRALLAELHPAAAPS